MRLTVDQKFAACVSTPGPLDTPCLIWPFGKSKAGYGQVGSGGKVLYTHRVAWERANGAIPDGIHCLHKCDTPACCNDSHLFLGTQADNNKDRVDKGRGRCGVGERNGRRTHPETTARGDRSGSRTRPESRPRGEKQGSAKLTDSQVLEIRAMYSAGGWSYVSLAPRFGVHSSTIRAIVTRVKWTHI